MRAKLIETYVGTNGALVKVYDYSKPRKGEVSWKPFEKYSVFNIGHQAMKNGRRGVQSTPG